MLRTSRALSAAKSIIPQKRYFNWFKFPTPVPGKTANTQAFYKHLDYCTYGFDQICPLDKFSVPGIYKLTNRKDSKIYIGMSLNVRKRIKQHLQDAFRYKYDNCGKYDDFSLVSQAVAKNDFDFNVEIVEKIPFQKAIEMTTVEKKKALKSLEKEWIGKLQSYRREIGYNVVR
jgi:hypothetical protein